MYSEKFLKFIEIWQTEFAQEASIDKKICRDKDGRPLPWYTYPATEYLSQFDYQNKKIFEFGCGYSSSFWAERAQSVVSIENDPRWYDKWQKEFCYANLDLRLREDNESYENAVLEDAGLYDVIAVDGRRRAQCCQTAVRSLAPGGMIILDDSDRVNTSADYVNAVKTLRDADLIQIDFYGFCPMNCYAKATSLFIRRDFNPPARQPVCPICGKGSLWSMGRRRRKEFFKKFEK